MNGATAPRCSDSSRAAAEPLAGSATSAHRWLLVEFGGRWGRDAKETELPSELKALIDGFDGRAQLIRRPDRRDGEPVLFVAESDHAGGKLWRANVSAGALELDDEIRAPLVLVCCHGRRDACCARLGTPVFEALHEHVADASVWQTSHVGGHRFAANVLVLPAGILLGRVTAAAAAHVAAELLAGRIPLQHYRGRTLDSPEAQAAEAAVRTRLGLAAVDDVVVVSASAGHVRLATPTGDVEARVEVEEGPPVVESCGKDPAPSVRFRVDW
jgi:hypothetical protein